MLEAKRTDNGQTIKLWNTSEDAIRQLMHEINENKELITCGVENCGCKMYVKALDSEKVVAHFARYPNTGNGNHPTDNTPESEDHILAKSKLAAWLQQSYPLAEITTEKWLLVGEEGYKKTRRIDVFVVMPDGTTEAHEVQLSNQNTAKTERRTRDYITAGITKCVWWWGGKTFDNHALKDWCIENCEHYGTIEIKYHSFMGKMLKTEPVLTLVSCAEIREIRAKREAQRILAHQAYLDEIRAANELIEKQNKERREALDRKNKEQEIARATLQAIEREERYRKSSIEITPTEFGGNAMIITGSYSAEHDAYQTTSGLWWTLQNGILVSYYGLTSTGEPYQVQL